MEFTIEEIREEFEKRKNELKELDVTLNTTKKIVENNNDENLKQGLANLEKYRENLIDIIENLKIVCKENFIDETSKKEDITSKEIEEYSMISKEIETIKNKYGKFMTNENKNKLKELEEKQKKLEQQIAAKFPDLNGKITEEILKDVQEMPEKEAAKKLIDEINEIIPMTEEELHKALFEGEDAIKAELPGTKKENKTLTAQDIEEMDEILNSIINQPKNPTQSRQPQPVVYAQRKTNDDIDKLVETTAQKTSENNPIPARKSSPLLSPEAIAKMNEIFEESTQEQQQEKTSQTNEENITSEQKKVVEPRIPKKIPKLKPQPQPVAPQSLTKEQRLLREMLELDEIDKKVKRKVTKEEHNGKIKRLMGKLKGFFLVEIEEKDEIGENENDRGKSL